MSSPVPVGRFLIFSEAITALVNRALRRSGSQRIRSNLGSSNLAFQDIDILGGTLNSGAVALNVIGTNTSKLRYVFSANLIVAQGATLTVGAGASVLIGGGVTLTDNANGTATLTGTSSVVAGTSSGSPSASQSVTAASSSSGKIAVPGSVGQE